MKKITKSSIEQFEKLKKERIKDDIKIQEIINYDTTATKRFLPYIIIFLIISLIFIILLKK
ncbi:hypothetical protein HYW20_08635 [Candidatus Woesearchaeota archaeon]|nr:hypothetical protein [Candidatus Woesearchaeota archaeon]